MPRKYESTTEEYSNEPTEFDKKCAELINLFNLSRPSLDDFRGRRNYDDAQIDRDENVVWLKQRGREERIGEYNATDQDKVLESIIYHMGAGHQLFAQETYTEPGSEYDDEFKGADVIFGIPQKNGERDVIFNVDACTAIRADAVYEKFKKRDMHEKPDSPLCNQIVYFAHGRTHTRISPSPNYIVGSMPAHVSKVAEGFDLSNIDNPSSEASEEFRLKILAEIYAQSATGVMACDNIAKPTDFTKKARKAHLTAKRASALAICQSCGIDPRAKDAFNQVAQKVNALRSQYSRGDDTFRHIMNESYHRYATERRKKMAQATANVGTKLSSSPSPAMA